MYIVVCGLFGDVYLFIKHCAVAASFLNSTQYLFREVGVYTSKTKNNKNTTLQQTV